VLAISYPIPGARLYTADHLAAGRIAGKTLGQFAKENWSEQTLVAAILGDVADQPIGRRAHPGSDGGVAARIAQRFADTIGQRRPSGSRRGCSCQISRNSDQAQSAYRDARRRFALAAKSAIETAGRTSDCVIVSQGLAAVSTAAPVRRRRSIRPIAAASFWFSGLLLGPLWL